jgi:adenylyltransferase/sulfurtransferase
MLVFDALSTRIRTVNLRGRNPQCAACGDNPQVDRKTLPEFDYEAFTSSPLCDVPPPRQQIVGEDQSITCRGYKEVREAHEAHEAGGGQQGGDGRGRTDGCIMHRVHTSIG